MNALFADIIKAGFAARRLFPRCRRELSGDSAKVSAGQKGSELGQGIFGLPGRDPRSHDPIRSPGTPKDRDDTGLQEDRFTGFSTVFEA